MLFSNTLKLWTSDLDKVARFWAIFAVIFHETGQTAISYRIISRCSFSTRNMWGHTIQIGIGKCHRVHPGGFLHCQSQNVFFAPLVSTVMQDRVQSYCIPIINPPIKYNQHTDQFIVHKTTRQHFSCRFHKFLHNTHPEHLSPVLPSSAAYKKL